MVSISQLRMVSLNTEIKWKLLFFFSNQNNFLFNAIPWKASTWKAITSTNYSLNICLIFIFRSIFYKANISLKQTLFPYTNSVNFIEIHCSFSLPPLKLVHEAKKIILLFPEMRVTRKIFTRATAKGFFNQFSWIFEVKFTLKNYSNNIFLCWKTKSPNFCCSNRK